MPNRSMPLGTVHDITNCSPFIQTILRETVQIAQSKDSGTFSVYSGLIRLEELRPLEHISFYLSKSSPLTEHKDSSVFTCFLVEDLEDKDGNPISPGEMDFYVQIKDHRVKGIDYQHPPLGLCYTEYKRPMMDVSKRVLKSIEGRNSATIQREREVDRDIKREGVQYYSAEVEANRGRLISFD